MNPTYHNQSITQEQYSTARGSASPIGEPQAFELKKEKKTKKRKAENPASNILCVRQAKIILRKGTTT